jgi:hypothetical protein
MRKTLQRRLAHLESLAHLERRAEINVGPSRPFLIRFVATSDPEPWEPTRAEACGRVWHREPGETVEDFENRVIADARNHDPLVSVIYFDCAKEDDAEDDADFNPGTSSSEPDASPPRRF